MSFSFKKLFNKYEEFEEEKKHKEIDEEERRSET